MQEKDSQRNRLIYRANYRGTKEMDMLIGTFAKQIVPTLNEAQLQEFEVFLNEEDPDLFRWYSDKTGVPEESMTSVMKLFLAFDYSV